MKKNLRVGILISGGGSNLQAIIDACRNGTVDAEVVFVGTDNPRAPGLKRAAKYDIPTFAVDYAEIIRAFNRDPAAAELPGDFDLNEQMTKQAVCPEGTDSRRVEFFLKTRAIAEAALLAEMRSIGFDLLVLAGFMRNLSPYFIDRVNTDRSRPRIMNIHPALLPAFAGSDGYGDTFRYGCRVGGCTVHFVDYGEDTGPIIGQRAFPIDAADSLEGIRRRGLEEEWQLYPQCIQLYARGRLRTVRKSWDLGKGRIFARTVVEVISADRKDA